MAERLGEALLELRTDDKAFTQGVQRAKGEAEKLGQSLDKTKASSSQLGGEMGTTGARAAQLGQTLDKASGSAVRLAAETARSGQGVLTLGKEFEVAGQRVTASAGAQRAGFQQLSLQLSDVATMYALGARPSQIFASQIGQITQAVQLAAGGTSRWAAFLGGPWGIAIGAAVAVLAPFVGKLFESKDALDGVEFASSRLSDAQGILGGVIDRTTGQINTQSQALLALARAQAAAGMVGAMQRQASARSELASISRGGLGDLKIEGSMGGARIVRADNGQSVVDQYRAGKLSPTEAEGQLRARMDAGYLTPQAYFRAAQAITGDAVEGANVKVFQDTLSALDGNSAAARSILGPQGGGPRARGGSPAAGPRGRSESEIAGDFSAQSVSIERETLQARLSLASSAQDRADIQRELLALDRSQRLAEIQSSDLTEDMKASLTRQVEELYGREVQYDEQGNMIATFNRGLEAEIIARELARRQADDAQQLADERFRGEMDLLQNALALADTQALQKDIALKIYDAQVAEERLRLQKIIDLEAIGAATKQEADLARERLKSLNAGEASGRAAVGRQNQTDTERYLERINKTPGQINEAIEAIQIDGLEALNDGLTKAIMGAESLGDVFSRIADQIIADLLRIAIQQAVIRPLANSLFGGGGGGLGGGGGGFGGFFSSIFGGGGGKSLGGGASGLGSLFASFAGGFATGGTIPTGKFAVVGEEGPELAFAGPGGLGIISNPQSRQLLSSTGGGTTITIPISIDATGADAAAIARLNAQLDQLRQELPTTIVTTVREAKDRRFLS